MPTDARAFPDQPIAHLRIRLRDNRFVRAAAMVSKSSGSRFDSKAAPQPCRSGLPEKAGESDGATLSPSGK